MTPANSRARWLALYILCAGVLMVVLDTTVVTVALPSIQSALQFGGTDLTWVLNAYMLTFGGFLLLGGRLGDLYGQRKLFLIGLVLFTLASLGCGIAQTQGALIAGRALQGLGGAVLSAVALSLIMNLFQEEAERAKAMGIYGFVMACGGSLGELLGGWLTNEFGWHSIFLVNLPIGVAVYWACVKMIPADVPTARVKLDVAGAMTVTLGLMLAVYAVVGGNAAGWLSATTLSLLGVAAALIAAFLLIESRVSQPLMPLRMFGIRSIATSNIVGVLWAAGMFGWFVISALYLQNVLGYDPFKVGLSFLPADVIMAIFSAGLSAKMVMRYGLREPAWIGLVLAAIGLVLFAHAPENGTYVVHVLPGMVLLGLGAGMAFNPVLMAAMSEVSENESGLASGLVNTSFMLGGALGLAVLASLADARTASATAAGVDSVVAANSGYQLAFLIAAGMCALGAAICAVGLKPRKGTVP